MKFPLMRNNIHREDLDAVIEHLKQDDPILTNGANVRAFEEEWSQWLGVKYSVFLNSGASSNLLTMAVLKIRHPEGGEVIVPPLTWISNISSVLQNGFTPVFVDIDPRTLAMDTQQVIDKLTDKTRAVFLTHVQGFNGLTDELIDGLKQREVPLIEDVCESHGATHNGQKAGTFGWISNFFFYYAHHMSTIEGGMVCTDGEAVYQQVRMLRSHGMVCESNNADLRARYQTENPEFIFAYPAYNMRNTEIGGIMGKNQLKRLDANIARRTENLHRFLNQLDPNKYRTNFKLEGSSNYAFNLVLKRPDAAFVLQLMDRMRESGIKYWRGGSAGGNQIRQPYLQDLVLEGHHRDFPETEHIHFYDFIGNFPDLRDEEVDEICAVLNAVSNNGPMSTAIILAGGLDTRLRKSVLDLLKPMAPINNRPFLEYQLEYWARQGVDRFILSVGYRRQTIIDYFGIAYRGIPIDYAVEQTPLGTGGGLLHAAEGLTEPFLVLNGDTFFEANLEELRGFHAEHGSEWTLALFRTSEIGRYMGVEVADDGRLLLLQSGIARPGRLANGSAYLVKPSVLSAFQPGREKKCSLEDDLLHSFLEQGRKLYGVDQSGRFIDIGIPEDYLRSAGVLLQ